MARNTKSRPHFTQAVELCNAIGDAGGFDAYDVEDLEPPPLAHFEALLMQGYTAKQIMASCIVPPVIDHDNLKDAALAVWYVADMR